MNVPRNNLMVRIWDLGPKKPEAPKKPDVPKGKDGDPEFELAKIEFEGALVIYRADLIAYGRARIDYDNWQANMGGPAELEMWSVGAKDAKARDPDRYVDKLPRGVKPGPGHFKNLEREQERMSEQDEAARRDPQFGEQRVPA